MTSLGIHLGSKFIVAAMRDENGAVPLKLTGNSSAVLPGEAHWRVTPIVEPTPQHAVRAGWLSSLLSEIPLFPAKGGMLHADEFGRGVLEWFSERVSETLFAEPQEIPVRFAISEELAENLSMRHALLKIARAAGFSQAQIVSSPQAIAAWYHHQGCRGRHLVLDAGGQQVNASIYDLTDNEPPRKCATLIVDGLEGNFDFTSLLAQLAEEAGCLTPDVSGTLLGGSGKLFKLLEAGLQSANCPLVPLEHDPRLTAALGAALLNSATAEPAVQSWSHWRVELPLSDLAKAPLTVAELEWMLRANAEWASGFRVVCHSLNHSPLLAAEGSPGLSLRDQERVVNHLDEASLWLSGAQNTWQPWWMEKQSGGDLQAVGNLLKPAALQLKQLYGRQSNHRKSGFLNQLKIHSRWRSYVFQVPILKKVSQKHLLPALRLNDELQHLRLGLSAKSQLVLQADLIPVEVTSAQVLAILDQLLSGAVEITHRLADLRLTQPELLLT